MPTGIITYDKSPLRADVTTVSDDTIMFSFTDNRWDYEATLHSGDGKTFMGHWTTARKGGEDSGPYNAKLFRCGNEQLLYGKWTEAGEDYVFTLAIE